MKELNFFSTLIKTSSFWEVESNDIYCELELLSVYANCFYNLQKPHYHYSYSFLFCQLFCTFLDTQFSGKRGKLPRYLHTSFSTPLVSVIYYCPWNLSYKHANTNDMAGLPNWWTFFINIIFAINFLKKINQDGCWVFISMLRIILDVWCCIC